MSKGLEALEKIKSQQIFYSWEDKMPNGTHYLETIEKELKALYIIKKYKTLRELNVDYISNKREKKLLKEVLKDE